MEAGQPATALKSLLSPRRTPENAVRNCSRTLMKPRSVEAPCPDASVKIPRASAHAVRRTFCTSPICAFSIELEFPREDRSDHRRRKTLSELHDRHSDSRLWWPELTESSCKQFRMVHSRGVQKHFRGRRMAVVHGLLLERLQVNLSELDDGSLA